MSFTSLTKPLINYAKGILSAPDGEPSSKRLITLIAMMLISIGFIANLFWGFAVTPFMFESVMYILIAGMGITSAEKFINPRDFSKADD